MWLAQLSAGGDITVQFRACHKGKATDNFEKGTWWFADGTEYIRITWSGGRTVLRETPYRILSHYARRQSYAMPDGFVFKSSRVGRDFQMPSCELTS
jgi:hypothetical protein